MKDPKPCGNGQTPGVVFHMSLLTVVSGVGILTMTHCHYWYIFVITIIQHTYIHAYIHEISRHISFQNGISTLDPRWSRCPDDALAFPCF